jgi:hypothetical protein
MAIRHFSDRKCVLSRLVSAQSYGSTSDLAIFVSEDKNYTVKSFFLSISYESQNCHATKLLN